MRLARPKERDVAYELGARAQDDGRGQPLALGSEHAAGDLPRQKLARLLGRSGICVEPARDQLVAVDVVETLLVRGLERAEEQALGHEGPGRGGHRRTVRGGGPAVVGSEPRAPQGGQRRHA